MGEFPKDKYGVRFTLPDTMSDKEKLKSLKNIKQIMKTFADVAGEEAPDMHEIDEAITKLTSAHTKLPQSGEDK